ncbi:AdeC/AdeK/OprM family multidrug efflux complex outer membrane factor [Halopseudomonas pelagia]|uniref:AdeC/AdeK/OprM family multidrug efflux complex outer membrane factor n=1 Tax=Halopseudomonas pelagia TaxID=553151 RepID=UPI00039BBBF6|nr:AdeC/AdeK/OprM family multidrug efflux complex outer membrane factor [Halopseudomonas pelagia]
MKIRYLTLAVALGLSGCSLIPEYQQPASPVADAWPQGAAYAGAEPTAAGALPLDRRAFFQNPQLQQLIDLALENNRDLRQAALNVEAYRALYRIQRSELLPSIGVDGSGNRQRLPSDLSPTGESGINSQYGVGLGTSAWELDFFGRIRSLQGAALERYLATEEAQRSVQIALVSDVANAWLAWNTDHALLELTQATLDSYRESLEMVEASHAGGIASALDVRQARSLVEQARVQLALYTRQLAEDHNALQLLMGTRIPSELLLGTELDAPLLADLPAGLPADVMQQRPDIRAAEHQLRAANADIGAARAAFFPSISLTASAGTASADLDGLFDGGSGTWSFIPQINIPIFTAGRLRANLEYSEIQRDINVAQYEQSIQTAFREVSDGLAARGTFDEQLQAQNDLVVTTSEYYELAQQRYDEGVDNYLVVLDAQRELFASQQQQLAYRLQQLTNEVALYRALGGGWQSAEAPAPQTTNKET